MKRLDEALEDAGVSTNARYNSKAVLLSTYSSDKTILESRGSNSIYNDDMNYHLGMHAHSVSISREASISIEIFSGDLSGFRLWRRI